MTVLTALAAIAKERFGFSFDWTEELGYSESQLKDQRDRLFPQRTYQE